MRNPKWWRAVRIHSCAVEVCQIKISAFYLENRTGVIRSRADAHIGRVGAVLKPWPDP